MSPHGRMINSGYLHFDESQSRMISLSGETEALALRLVAAQSLSVETAIRQALENQARAAALSAYLVGVVE